MLKRLILPLLVIGLALVIFVMLSITKPQPPIIDRPETGVLVETQTLEFETLAPTVKIYGRLESPQLTQLRAAINADVEMVHVYGGQEVAAGDILVELDKQEAQLEVQRARAELELINAQIEAEKSQLERNQTLLGTQQQLADLAQSAVKRAETLQQSQLTSQALLDEAISLQQQQILTLKQRQFDIKDHPIRLAQLNANREQALAALDRAELDLRRTVIQAPFAGRISERHIAEGNRVQTGDLMITLYGLQQIELRAAIPERYLADILPVMDKQDLVATARIAGNNYQFVLKRLSGVVEENVAGRDGLFRLINQPGSLALGQFMSAQFKLPTRLRTVAIPYSALYGLNRVYRVRDGQLEAVTVQKIGDYDDLNGKSRLLIQSEALQEGDLIITTQLPNAIDGLVVTIKGKP